jgi:serine/threonine protein kinase
MFVDKDSSEIKLIDFGLSKRLGIDPNMTLASVVGTPYYVAPEVLS